MLHFTISIVFLTVSSNEVWSSPKADKINQTQINLIFSGSILLVVKRIVRRLITLYALSLDDWF